MSNYIGPDEVAHYNAAAATLWQEDGPMWPLHKLNDLRAPCVTEQICRHLAIAPELAEPMSRVKVLDIGCGAGLLSEALAARARAPLNLQDQQILNCTGVSINPITRHYRLADYLGVNNMLTARRLLEK